jgi:excisionase family DNA binding protein
VSPPVEVTITAPDYWATRPAELIALLSRPTGSGATTIADPSGRPPDPAKFAVVAAPERWAAYPREIQEALSGAVGAVAEQGLAAGAIAPVGERLVLTVEEAATLLGISRAFAYEAVNSGTIPSIRIGRRILVPKAALNRLVGAEPMPPQPASA